MSIVLSKIEAYKNLFGDNVKRIRESKNLSQFELASRVNDLTESSNFDKTSVSRIENGRTNITLSTAIKLSLALEVEPKDLFDFKSSK